MVAEHLGKQGKAYSSFRRDRKAQPTGRETQCQYLSDIARKRPASYDQKVAIMLTTILLIIITIMLVFPLGIWVGFALSNWVVEQLIKDGDLIKKDKNV